MSPGKARLPAHLRRSRSTTRNPLNADAGRRQHKDAAMVQMGTNLLLHWRPYRSVGSCHRGSRSLRGGTLASESSRDMVSNKIRRPPERIRVEMRVTRRRRGLRVAEKPADDRKSKARACAYRRERVPKIMDAPPFETRVPLNRSPGLLKVRARPIRVRYGDDKDAAALAVLQEINRNRTHDNRLSTRLTVGQVD